MSRIIKIIKIRQENFLTCLDRILSRFYQGVPIIIFLSSSWQDVSSFVRVIKILHDVASCIKLRYTGIVNNDRIRIEILRTMTLVVDYCRDKKNKDIQYKN